MKFCSISNIILFPSVFASIVEPRDKRKMKVSLTSLNWSHKYYPSVIFSSVSKWSSNISVTVRCSVILLSTSSSCLQFTSEISYSRVTCYSGINGTTRVYQLFIKSILKITYLTHMAYRLRFYYRTSIHIFNNSILH